MKSRYRSVCVMTAFHCNIQNKDRQYILPKDINVLMPVFTIMKCIEWSTDMRALGRGFIHFK